LVFVSRLPQLFSLQQAFEAIDVDVQAVTGSTGKEKRDQIINRFREGQFPVLINCGALVEGADMPCVSSSFYVPRSSLCQADTQIDCLVLARPTTSKILMTQMVSTKVKS
jgi:ATP-dependent helicase IRC3